MIYFMKKNSLWEIKNNILINKGGKEGVSEIPSLSIFQWRVKKVIKTKITRIYFEWICKRQSNVFQEPKELEHFRVKK